MIGIFKTIKPLGFRCFLKFRMKGSGLERETISRALLPLNARPLLKSEVPLPSQVTKPLPYSLYDTYDPSINTQA